jgi:hypothetical protein
METDNNLEQKRPTIIEEHSLPINKEKTEHPHRKTFEERKKNNRNFEKYHHKKRIRHDVHHKKESIEKEHKTENRHDTMDIKLASKTAKEKLSDALNKKANTVVSVSKEGDIWNAVIEIIDEEYLPGKNLDSMSDIIGVYDVKLSDKGELLSWNKKSSRKRGNTSV